MVDIEREGLGIIYYLIVVVLGLFRMLLLWCECGICGRAGMGGGGTGWSGGCGGVRAGRSLGWLLSGAVCLSSTICIACVFCYQDAHTLPPISWHTSKSSQHPQPQRPSPKPPQHWQQVSKRLPSPPPSPTDTHPHHL